MDREGDTAELEGNVQKLTTRNRPYFILGIPFCALHPPVDCVGHGPRDLGQCETRIDDGDKFTVRCLVNNRLVLDGIPVGSYDPILVRIHLPVLVEIRKSRHGHNVQFRL